MKTLYAITDGKAYASFASKYHGIDNDTMTLNIDHAHLFKTKNGAQKVVDMENENWRGELPQLSVVEVKVTLSL